MRFSLLVVAFAALACIVAVQAQAPIPYRPDGFQIGGAATAPIVFDAFVDLLCPDCAAAWPTIKQVTDYYASNIAVAIHLFPLPYHTHAFEIAQAANVVIGAGGAAPRAYFDFMFGAQQSYWNAATFNQTGQDVLDSLTSAVVGAGYLPAQAFLSGMANANTNENTRVSWKFGCSKGVLGTPTFFVNGVNVNGDPSWTLAEWRTILDPLLQPQPQAHQAVSPAKAEPKKDDDCPSSYYACGYNLNGSVKCCPNVPQPPVGPVDPSSCPAGFRECYSISGAPKCCPDSAVKVAVAEKKQHKSKKMHAKKGKHAAAAKPKCTQRTAESRTFVKRGGTCPAGEPSCAYLPGKQECCLPGEMCIPNVGCRC